MGDGDKTPLRLQFDPKVRLEFHGATITSDAGLLPIRELDDALGLTHIAADYLQESRSGRNIRHHLVPLLRESIYSRLAGYDDTNDAERLSQDPAMRVVVGWRGSDRNAALRFTQLLHSHRISIVLMRMAMRIMLRTWLRVSECLSLCPADPPIISLRPEVTGNKVKRGREVHIPADLVECLEDLVL